MHDPTKSNVTLRRLLLLAASLGVVAAGWFLLGEGEAVVAGEPAGRTVLARLDGAPITEKEILELAAVDLLKLERQRHEVLESVLEKRVRERLLAAAAEKRGISRGELVKAEVDDKLADVPQREVDAFYEARRTSIRQPQEAVETQIREILAREALMDRLEATHEVELLMEPFRVEVDAVGSAKGPADAPVTIVEFSDFECAHCGRVKPSLARVARTYGDRVRIVFRHYPLEFHPNARKAGEAALCAAEQGDDYFWRLHDAMFADQENLSVADLEEKAAAIEGLDRAAFTECLDSGRRAAALERDIEAGARAGVAGTPAFFINGRFLAGEAPYESFAEIIEDELARAASSS